MSKASPKRKTAAGRSTARTAKAKGRRPASRKSRALMPGKNGLFGVPAGEEQDAEGTPTERQMEIYAFIRDKIHNRGYGPTVREIGQAFKIKSPNGVVCHLKALERKNMITRGKNMSRAIELVNEPAHLRGLRMLGWVAAGTLRPAE